MKNRIGMIQSGARYAGMLLLAAFLPQTAYAAGLPGQYLISERWRALLAARSPLSNPAFLTDQHYTSVRGAFSGGVNSVATLWEMGAVFPVGLYQSLAITGVGEAGKEIQDGTLDASGRYAAGERSTNSTFLGSMSYAVNPWRTLSLGVNINAASQSNFGKPRHGFGGDLAVSYRIVNHPLFGYHHAGLLYQNVLGPNLLAQGVDRYSSRIKATLHSRFALDRLENTIEFTLADFTADPAHFVNNDKTIDWEATWITGVWLLRFLQGYGLVGFDRAGLHYWGWAAGINFPSANRGRDFSILYQYRNETALPLRPSHSLYARIDLGAHREERFVRRTAREIGLAPGMLYNKAMALFTAGNYWDALFVFREILARFPGFFKNDWVHYYTGRCFELMDMRVEAAGEYTAAAANHPASEIVSYADLGLMRISYRDRDHLEVSTLFNRLNSDRTPDSLRSHASYLMGQTYLRTDAPEKAIQAFAAIPETHTDYMFAQYSKAIAHIRELQLEPAMEALQRCIESPARTSAQREMVNRSYVALGYMFYEELSLPRAVTAFRLTPQESRYYPDALLGLSWTALKSRQWGDCIESARSLANATEFPALRAEAFLLRGYALFMQKEYTNARQRLETGLALLDDTSPPTEEILRQRTERYRQNRWQYNDIAQRANELARQPLTTEASVLDSLQKEQRLYRDSLAAYLDFLDTFERRAFFARSRETIRGDIEYALTIIAKILGSADQIDAGREEFQRSKQLDSEIEKLKEEIEQLE